MSSVFDRDAAYLRGADLTAVPPSLRGLLQSELRKGEEITWMGSPIPGRFAVRALPLFLFAIPWTAFAVFWMVSARIGGPAFTLFGVPFVLVGLGMLSSPLWMLRRAKNTAYVLTNQRAILLVGGFSTTIRSFAPDRLTDLRRTQRRDGSGDLVFERHAWRDSEGDRQTTDYGFLAIADVKAVEDRVRQLAASAM